MTPHHSPLLLFSRPEQYKHKQWPTALTAFSNCIVTTQSAVSTTDTDFRPQYPESYVSLQHEGWPWLTIIGTVISGNLIDLTQSLSWHHQVHRSDMDWWLRHSVMLTRCSFPSSHSLSSAGRGGKGGGGYWHWEGERSQSLFKISLLPGILSPRDRAELCLLLNYRGETKLTWTLGASA